MNATIACDQIQAPPPAPCPLLSGDTVEALLLCIKGAPPERMQVPRHTHAIELPDGRCFTYCPELSEAMGHNVFVPEGLKTVHVTIGIRDLTDSLPATPPRHQPEPMQPLLAYEISRR